MTARDAIAGVLAEHDPAVDRTWGNPPGDWCRCGAWVPEGTRRSHEAQALIDAGVTLPGVTEREKARACWCEKVLKRGLFGTEWKCRLRAGHDGECR